MTPDRNMVGLKTAVCVQSIVRRSYIKYAITFRILTDYIPSEERAAVTCQSKLAYASCGTAGQLRYRTAAEHTPPDGYAVNRAIRATADADERNANRILKDCSVSLTNVKNKIAFVP